MSEHKYLEPHRVMQERDELSARFSQLGRLLTLDKTAGISAQERALLAIQYSLMNAYLQLLELRIQKF
jgi:hypothetical protein